MTTRAKGTGLGLAIVRKVIEEHGGNLSFADDHMLGETGARMTITLPLEAGPLEARSSDARPLERETGDAPQREPSNALSNETAPSLTASPAAQEV